MRKSLVLLLLIVAAHLMPLPASAGTSWTYGIPGNGQSGFTISKTKKTMEIGSLKLDVKFCDEMSAYLCFESEGLSFAVPRALGNKEQSWASGGQRYTAVPVRVPLRIFGKTVSVYQIDSITQNPQMRFFYSKEKGLVVAKVLDEKNKSLLFLEEACGFGAPRRCH
jgi:hypothetical protein